MVTKDQMSMNRYNYLGPSLWISKVTLVEQVEIRTCSNGSCVRYGRHISDLNSDFCSKCGAQFGLVYFPRRKRVDLYDLTGGAFAEVALSNGSALFPNQARLDRPKRDSPSPGEDGYTTITPRLLEEEVTWFEKAFATEIKAIRDVVGVENVTVHWGQVDYTM